MATGSTVFRIEANVSDLDAGRYETLTIRLAQHASEDRSRLAARVIAYCLAYEEGLEFGRGLEEANDPALSRTDATGKAEHWIDIGHPGAERLHRARKACDRVTVVCHKPAAGLVRERAKRAIHKADTIAVWLLDPDLVEALGESMERTGQWTLLRTGQELLVNIGDKSFSGSFVETTLSAL